MCIRDSVAIGCIHKLAPVVLDKSLSLELKAPTSLTRGGRVTLVFTLRNVGNRSVAFCLVDSGVSVFMSTPTLGQRALVMHGMVMDASCWRPEQLAPNEQRSYEESVLIPDDLDSVALLTAVLRVHWPPEGWKSGYGRGDADIWLPEKQMQIVERHSDGA